MPPAASNLARLHVETLFTVHSIFSGLVGSVSFLLPHVGEFFLVPHGEKLKLRDNANREDQVPHLIIRLLGALLLLSPNPYRTWKKRCNMPPHPGLNVAPRPTRA
jgi:hypothetical protein